MQNGHDLQGRTSNVVSLAGARRQAKSAANTRAGHGLGERRQITAGQWLTSALFVVLAIGGVFALAAPLLRATGIVGG
jgi:hypothetical protein